MRILLSHRFFWPDSPPYASMLRSIGRHFAATGHSVTVFSAQPSYRPGASDPKQAPRETLDGMQVRRIKLLKEKRKDFLIRGFNGALYSIRLFLHILFSRRYDLVMVSTFPPILLAFLACFACKVRGCSFIYHCQDIHPEVSILAKGGKFVLWLSLLRIVDQWTCRNASTIVVLSEDMRHTLMDRSVDARLQIRIINNFDLPQFGSAIEAREVVNFPSTQSNDRVDPDICLVVFAGNLGRFQSLDTVVRAAALLTDLPELRVVFMGDGVMKEELKRLAADLFCNNVDFMSFQKPADAKRLIARADFGLVTLRPGMHKVAYPSKTMTYLGAGCPVIAMVDPESELAKLVTSERLGLVVRDTTPFVLAQTFREGCRRRETWRNEHSRLSDYANQHSSEKAVLHHWERLFASL